MVRVNPFHAVRPTADAASRVASVPYDVVSTDEARALAEGNPDSFLHVVRPEVDLPAGTDPHADEVYAGAKRALDGLIERGVMARDVDRGIFLYAQEADLMDARRRQVGVVCCCHVQDYLDDRIKKHEKTRQAKEDDRTRHVLETNANAGPVFLLHKDDDGIAAAVARDTAADPIYDFTAPDGVRHTVWVAADPAPYIDGFRAHEAVYVADGHHRSASAARAATDRRSNNPGHTGEEEYNWFLSVLFPASDLTVLPYNRLVRDLNGLSAEDLLAELRGVGEVTPLDGLEKYPSIEPGGCCALIGGRWHALRFDPSRIDRSDPVARLDYQALYDLVLGPILGIGDVRTDDRIDFVGGIRGTDELDRRVASGDWAVAFAMPAVTIDQLIAVADAGTIMPPKSTWFEPKLRSGLLVHMLD